MPLNIGIAGAGEFAAFATSAFLKVPGIRLIAVIDVNESVSTVMAQKWGAASYSSYDQFLLNADIELVYIASPPYLHYSQSKKALQAGKHVICEKPAALRYCESEELSMLSRSGGLLYVVNLMQRYNPLYDVVKMIVDKKILGGFSRGFFENYAANEKLLPGHWFWDKEKSGGIFIEHGVHFFDLFSGWLGKGKIISAQQLHAIESPVINRVQAITLYNGGLVNFYHGFDQPCILDRQEMRLQFEHGDITLSGWIPLNLRLHGLVDKDQLEELHQLPGNLSVVHHALSKPTDSKPGNSFSDLANRDLVTIEYGNTVQKEDRYAEMLESMISDQWKWINSREHKRVIDDSNALESLRMAEEATIIAQTF